MDVAPLTPTVAALMGDATRSRMLECLMDGRARTAKELAYSSSVSPQTASFHLAKLVRASLLQIQSQGRHRYYQLAHADVARTIEAMMSLAGRPFRSSSAEPVTELPPIKLARFCYDHIAGRLGVDLLTALVRRRCLSSSGNDFEVTRSGEKFLSTIGVDVAAARHPRRRFACSCLDWSERTPHLAGSLGSALADQLMAAKWIRRVRESRVVVITDEGRKALASQLDLTIPQQANQR